MAEKHARDFGSHFDVAECLINIGGKHAIFDIIEALVDDGDEVIIPTPYWVSFLDIVQFAGAKPVFVHTRQDDGFRLTAAMLEKAITAKTRMIVANSRTTPAAPLSMTRNLSGLPGCVRNAVSTCLTMSAMRTFSMMGGNRFRWGAFPEFKNTVVIAGSLSKTYAMTGWRIGYILAVPEIIQGALKLQSHSTSNPVSFAQKAAIEAVTGPQDSIREMLTEYSKRRKYVVERLRSIPGVTCANPGGAFYAYPEYFVGIQTWHQGQHGFFGQTARKTACRRGTR